MLPSISFTLTEKSSTSFMVSLNLLSLRHLGFTDEADTEVGWWTLTASAASWNMFEHETDEKDAVTQVVSDGERSVGIYSDTEEIQIVSHRTVTVCCSHCCHHCCSSGEGWSRSHSASFVSSSYAPDSCCCNTIITMWGACDCLVLHHSPLMTLSKLSSDSTAAAGQFSRQWQVFITRLERCNITRVIIILNTTTRARVGN